MDYTQRSRQDDHSIKTLWTAASRLKSVWHLSQDVAEACLRPDPAARPTFSKLVTDLAALLEAANAGTIQVREPSQCDGSRPQISPAPTDALVGFAL